MINTWYKLHVGSPAGRMAIIKPWVLMSFSKPLDFPMLIHGPKYVISWTVSVITFTSAKPFRIVLVKRTTLRLQRVMLWEVRGGIKSSNSSGFWFWYFHFNVLVCREHMWEGVSNWCSQKVLVLNTVPQRSV